MAKKLRIWLSAPSLPEQDFGQINVLLKDFELIFNRHLLEQSNGHFNKNAYLDVLKTCDLFLGIIQPKTQVDISKIGVNNILIEERKWPKK